MVSLILLIFITDILVINCRYCISVRYVILHSLFTYYEYLRSYADMEYDMVISWNIKMEIKR